MPESTRTKKTVAVDFDGVIHSYESGWQGVVPTDPPREGALEFVQQLLAKGFQIVYHTARANTQPGLDATVQWLMIHGFPAADVTAMKPPAIAYVDDRAVYAGRWSSWEGVLKDIDAIIREHGGK